MKRANSSLALWVLHNQYVMITMLMALCLLSGCAEDSKPQEQDQNITQCEPVCGEYATCDPETQTCSCDAGYIEGGNGCEPIACSVDADCDNGVYCDGREICDQSANSCESGDAIACSGDRICNESEQACTCPEGKTSEGDSCVSLSCVSDADCIDDDPCNGVEACDMDTNTCTQGEAVDCGPAGTCVSEGETSTCECGEGGIENAGKCYPECPVPQTYTVRITRPADTLNFTTNEELGIEYAVSSPEMPESEITWTVGTEIGFDGEDGSVRVLARVSDASCMTKDQFTHVYEVRESFAPAAGQEGTTAIAGDAPQITGWVTGYSEVVYGEEVEEKWRTPEKIYGPVNSSVYAVCVLGRGGQITLTFDQLITDGEGPDFAVFENSFNDEFLEIARVEVSSDGEYFEPFDMLYAGEEPLGGFGQHSPTLFTGLAGKYRAGFGTPFDLRMLRNRPAVTAGKLNLQAITHVRIIDVVGDGAMTDSVGHPIYDPYPTVKSAGFDLAGVAVLHGVSP